MFNYSPKEEEILKFWEEQKIFAASLKRPSPQGNFVFYEGPPTANGKPGLHHVLARSFKDLVSRYKTMRGYHVERKAGWDTHGLPVELQVQKELGLVGKPDIEKFGIEKFNQKCRESVWKFKQEWENLTKRMGFWLDLEHPYITYESYYIDSIWWILKQIWDQNLIYQGFKVVPHCPSCGTTLSSHEVAQGYKTVTDRSVYLKFKVTADYKAAKKSDYILSWTTTPWTLPGNVALAVGEKINYVRVKVGPDVLILAENLWAKVIDGEAQVLTTFPGKDLIGTKYEPLFAGVVDGADKAWEVLPANFVSTEDGTGIVHTAVMYGVDDYELGLQFGLPQQHSVDLAGKFLANVKGFEGLSVKEPKTEEKIIQYLRDHNILYKEASCKHEYPFCWRCDTPLLYYAKTSWFIAVTKVQQSLLKNASTINWYPDHIKKGRFGEWLEGVKDWALSRERYWGTPLPIWICQQCQKQKMLGSISELPEKMTDVHRPFIDAVKLKCDCGGQMSRVPEVIDVWFDAGSMPFAQYHYPFEHEDNIDRGISYPADFISEGMDQTRGWFYTMLAISTLLKKGASYKNVICLGLINDARGQKMSKSKGNIVVPEEVIAKFGVDPLRYYFYTVSQPGEAKNFDEKNILEIVRKVFSTLSNIVSFYQLYAAAEAGKISSPQPVDIMDKWILALLQQNIQAITDHLENYRITEAARLIGDFINELSTWYVRRSRDRFKDETRQKEAVATLGYVLKTLSQLMAPFTPFMAESLWQDLRLAEAQSVHLSDWPEVQDKLKDEVLLKQMEQVRNLVEAAHAVRAQAKLKIRQPLAQAAIIVQLIPELQTVLTEEINVLQVVADKTLPAGESWMPADNGQIALDLQLTDQLRQEGNLRELIRFTNALRKQAKLTPRDSVVIRYQTSSTGLKQLIAARNQDLQTATISRSWEEGELFTEQSAVEVSGEAITLSLRM
ncbi:MAG: isoleucine--tRNA ligase [Candidatus Komeilibacteria bacterium]